MIIDGKILELYQRIGSSLKHNGKVYSEKLIEEVGCIFSTNFAISDTSVEKSLLKDELPEYPWAKKGEQEKSHYDKLFSGLVHSFAENYYYLSEQPDTTRRIVVTSSDCISVISVIIRGNDLYMNVFMRSSHYDWLLPSDLYFLCGIPKSFLSELERIRVAFDAEKEWAVPEIGEVHLSITFSSLHGFK